MSASYTVLARKWRPQQFDELVGQEHVAQTLTNAIEQKRIAHAYLFCGPRGIGKTSTARIFAKALNCEKGPTTKPCDHCTNCQEIMAGNSMDVLEIDGASNNGVEQVRELRENVRYATAKSKFKIYIIDEVHMLSNAAFNALLKTLEEPPAHVKFVFATTEPEKMLPTILSRCQRFDLRRIPSRLIIAHLTKIAKADKVKVEPAALSAIARGSEGSMRDAQSTLDQLISFCGDKIGEEDVLSMFGLAASEQIESLATAILEADASKALAALGKIMDAGKDLSRLLTDLLEHFRNLMILQVSASAANMLDLPDDELQVLKKQAQTVDAEITLHILEVLAASEGRLKWATSKRILLELTILKAIQARGQINLETVLKTLQSVRAQMAGGGGSVADPLANAEREVNQGKTREMFLEEATVQKTGDRSQESGVRIQSPAAPTSQHSSSPTQSGSQASSLIPQSSLADIWSRVLEAVSRASPFTKSYLVEARPVSCADGIFTVGYDPEFAEHKNLVDTAKHRQVLQTKLREVVGHEVTVCFRLIEDEGPRAEVKTQKPDLGKAERPGNVTADKTRSQKSSGRDFRDDPLIRQALEIFKGQIVEVKT